MTKKIIITLSIISILGLFSMSTSEAKQQSITKHLLPSISPDPTLAAAAADAAIYNCNGSYQFPPLHFQGEDGWQRSFTPPLTKCSWWGSPYCVARYSDKRLTQDLVSQIAYKNTPILPTGAGCYLTLKTKSTPNSFNISLQKIFKALKLR